MKDLQERLTQAGVWDAKLESELQALWKYGIERIVNERLRTTLVKFLCTVPVRFFTDPASRSGHLHPHWQNGRHGVLRSIIESCVLVPLVAQYMPELIDVNLKPDDRAIDVALAATIISDSCKKEDVGDVHYGPMHGRVAAERWQKFALAEGLDAKLAEEVAQGSIWHYGVYTPGWKPGTPLSPTTRLVNICDAITAQPALGIIYECKSVIV